MKAKDLIEILKQNPEAELCFYGYNGWTDELGYVGTAEFKGYKLESYREFPEKDYISEDGQLLLKINFKSAAPRSIDKDHFPGRKVEKSVERVKIISRN